MRQLIINLSTEKNQSKKDQILKMLENMGIEYQTSERQSLEEYNDEIKEAEKEIARGEFITAENLKKETRLW
jgi:phage terminase large subunit-like protein